MLQGPEQEDHRRAPQDPDRFRYPPRSHQDGPLALQLAQDSRFEARVCVTGQHRQMLDQVLELFGITPDYDLNIMKAGQDLTGVTTAILQGIKPVLAGFRYRSNPSQRSSKRASAVM